MSDICEIKSKVNRHKWWITLVLALSFIIPAGLTMLAYWMQNIYPGSEETILIYDLFAQYMPFYASLRNMFSGGNSLHFNWSCSLGGNYMGVFTYYLSSPITWLLALCDLQHLPDGIYFVSILRFGLCGLSMAAFLLFAPREQRVALTSREESENKKNAILSYVGILLLSSSYALMSYMFMYSISLMWIDVVILLPIVIWGLELLLEGRSGLYILSVFACLFCNYYIAYMVLIFTTLFFFALLIDEWQTFGVNWKNNVWKFIRSNILAIGLDAPFLCTSFLNLLQGRGDNSNRFVIDSIVRHNPIRILTQLFPQQYNTIETGGLPSVFCGTATVLLALVFFLFNRDIKEKVLSLSMLIILYLSFLIVPIDRAWHAFSEPNSYPHRYAFIWTFVVIYCAFRGYHILLKKWYLKRSLIIGIMCIYSVVELLFNGASHIAEHNINKNYVYRYEYNMAIEEINDMVDAIKQNGQEVLDRMDKNINYTANDPILLNYHGLSYFSSTYNRGFLDFLRSMGILQYHYRICLNGSTPITDSLFGIRYFFGTSDISNMYLELDENNLIYENPYSLGIGVVTLEPVDNDKLSEKIEEEQNPFKVQNEIGSSLTSKGIVLLEECDTEIITANNGALYDKLEELDLKDVSALRDNEATITFEAPCDGPLYLSTYLTDAELLMLQYLVNDNQLTSLEPKQGDFELLVNGKKADIYADSMYFRYNICLGDFTKGEDISVRMSGYTFPRDIYIASLNADAMKEWYGILEHRKLLANESVSSAENSIFNSILSIIRGSTILHGKVNVDSDGTLIMSLPYDTGYTVYIDGKAVETQKYGGALLSTYMPDGSHAVEVKYTTPGWNIGLLIFTFTLVSFIAGVIVDKKSILSITKSL